MKMSHQLNRCRDFVVSVYDSLSTDPGRSLIVVTILLLGVGLITIYSATSAEPNLKGQLVSDKVFKYMLALAVGIAVAAFVYVKGYMALRSYKLMKVMLIIMAVIFFAVPIVGPVINGARRWISFAGFSIQPSEFAKLFGVIWSAYFCDLMIRKKKRIRWLGSLKTYPMIGALVRDSKSKWVCRRRFPSVMLLAPAFFAAMTFTQPDTGTGILILAFSFLIWVAAGLNSKSLGIGLILVAVLLCIVFTLLSFHVGVENYRMARLVSWYDPFVFQQDKGYQIVQSLYAVASGGFFGQGLLQGTAKYFYLPEAHTDFAFAVWAQEWGFIGSLGVMLLFLAFIKIGLSISQQCRNHFGRLLALGITMIIGFQAIFNMLMACGGLPVTGVPLPFVSYGGSAAIMNLMCVGILLSIAADNQERRERNALSGEPEAHSMREETRSRFLPPKP